MSCGADPLVVRGVRKRIAGRTVLDDVTFTCPAGSLTALLGANGAGKTTVVGLAAGLRRPDAGVVTIGDADPRSRVGRCSLSLVPQEIGFPPTVPVCGLLDFVEGQRRPSPLAPSRAEICEALGLDPILARLAGGLSGGQRRRLAVALALLRVPRVLLLDEATANLDEQYRRTVWRLIGEYLDRGGTALATTHLLAEADAHAQRVVGLVHGRVVLAGTVDDLRRRAGGSVVTVSVPAEAAAAVVARVGLTPSATSTHDRPGVVSVSWRTPSPVRLCARLADESVAGLRLEVRPASLDDVLAALSTPVAAAGGRGSTPPAETRQPVRSDGRAGR